MQSKASETDRDKTVLAVGGATETEDVEDDETRTDIQGNGNHSRNIQPRSPIRTKEDLNQLERRYNEMQLEFERRENELLRRELEVARRENEQLRRAAPPATEGVHRKESINAMLELVGFFDGSAGTFRRWEQQIRQLCITYRLDDDRAKLLLSNKLKGKAKNWFQAEDTITMRLDEVMNGLRKMYDHRPI